MEWILLLVTTAMTIIFGIIGFFIKRTLAQFEVAQKQTDAKVVALEVKLNEFIQQMPFQYTLRDEFLRTIASLDNKLDRILENMRR